MPLERYPDVRYLSEVIKEEQRLLDDMFWEAMTPEDFIKAYNRETSLQYLEDLYSGGEEYYVAF